MNLAGVEKVFELEAALERMRRKVTLLERRAEELQGEIARLEEVKRTRPGGDRPLRGRLHRPRAGARAAALAAAVCRRANVNGGIKGEGFRSRRRADPRDARRRESTQPAYGRSQVAPGALIAPARHVTRRERLTALAESPRERLNPPPQCRS